MPDAQQGDSDETRQFKRIARPGPILNVFLKKTAGNMASKFLDFSEILENRAGGSKEEKSKQNRKREAGPTASFRLKPDGDSAANGSSTGAELIHYLAVVGVGLKVQQISGV